jgi:hypothetical protein
VTAELPMNVSALGLQFGKGFSDNAAALVFEVLHAIYYKICLEAWVRANYCLHINETAL